MTSLLPEYSLETSICVFLPLLLVWPAVFLSSAFLSFIFWHRHFKLWRRTAKMVPQSGLHPDFSLKGAGRTLVSTLKTNSFTRDTLPLVYSHQSANLSWKKKKTLTLHLIFLLRSVDHLHLNHVSVGKKQQDFPIISNTKTKVLHVWWFNEIQTD